MKNDSSSTMTLTYDKKTQDSYNNILEDKPYRTAQPKVSIPEDAYLTYTSEKSNLSSSRRCWKLSFRMFLTVYK